MLYTYRYLEQLGILLMCPQNENEISFHKEDSVLVLHLQQRALRKYSVPRKKINPGSKSTQRTCSLHTRGKRGTQYLKYGKISSIGLYIKYNPGSSQPKFPRHECMKTYATVGNSTDFSFDKIELQSLTGYSTVIASEFDRQECSSPKQTDQYSTELLLLGTVRTTAPQRNTYRQ